MMRKTHINASIIVLSLLFTFLGLELLSRIYKGEYSLKNFLSDERTLFTSSYPSQYDTELGWIPKEGVSGKKNVWNTEISIKTYGIRSNGKSEMPISLDMRPILAVGDSFTFGDQVSDWETWPAILEMLLKKKVINGGVFGYGFDQTYLRTERLIKIFNPDTIIFSFHPDDIERCELSERTAVGKPYFAVIDTKLVLKNVPVPKPSGNHVVGKFRQIFGYSYFIHKFMLRVNPGFWLQGQDWSRSTKVHNDGLKVTYLLFRKLEELCIANNIKMYIFVQYSKDLSSGRVKNVAEFFRSSTAELIDLKSAFSELKKRDKKKFERLFFGHMTYEGNFWVASKLQKIITKNTKAYPSEGQ